MNLIRKTVLHVETTYVDGDKEATKPLKMVAAAAGRPAGAGVCPIAGAPHPGGQ